MKKYLIGLMCLVAAGCSTSLEQTSLTGMKRRFVSLRQVYKGMTRKEVESALGSQIIVGYEMSDPQSGQYKPIPLKNPYRSEVFKKNFLEYTIDYYLVGINKSDGQVTDDELVPLVFLDNKLVDKGWDFLNQQIKN